MRHIGRGLAILVVAALFVGLVGCGRDSGRVRTIFTVEGMHCDACSTSIVTTLEKVKGVEEAAADHQMGTAEATYRSRDVAVDTLKTEIEKLGYTVIGMETETVDG